MTKREMKNSRRKTLEKMAVAAKSSVSLINQNPKRIDGSESSQSVEAALDRLINQ